MNLNFHDERRLTRRDWLRRSAVSAGAFGIAGSLPGFAPADEQKEPLVKAVLREQGVERELFGKVLIEDQQGGIVLLERDGHWWSLPADVLVSKETLADQTFAPLTAEELGGALQRELGNGFGMVIAEPYVICTNTNRAYAEWCGGLLNRLRTSFANFWKKDDLPFEEPEFPLPVLIFATRKQFAEYAVRTADTATAVSFGFYSVPFNRMAVFDLMEGAQGQPPRSVDEVNRRVQSSLSNVANVVHEGTHQVAYNCGLHTRFADNPLWLTEGMALFFEVPDLRSRTGWATMGRVNPGHAQQFARFVKAGRPADSLPTLIRTDERFLSAETAANAYAEAWGLTYFLIKRKRDEYAAYLRHIAGKTMLEFLDGDQRQAEFEQFFGDDWEALDKELLSALRRAR